MEMFKVMPSMNLVQPDATFFLGLETSAIAAQLEPTLDNTHAWALCEYLDAVDGGSISVKKVLYRQCVAALGDFLAKTEDVQFVTNLIEKSWAAKTLMEVLEDCSACKEARRQTA
ncbi:MAG: hypothetical protein Q7S87_09830 [Agitococcus sp.]|nr:hypothetical protein [Agitococcus sp.]MDO9177087.1 hypothetical protein [Agitococcus sp.]